LSVTPPGCAQRIHASRAVVPQDRGIGAPASGEGAGCWSRREIAAIIAALVVALAYCSWPLGLWLNPSTARTSLASSLEVAGQPFSWLFITLDCAAGAGSILVAHLGRPTARAAHERVVRVGLIFYAIFGIGTAIDALVPSDCGASVSLECAANLNQLSVDDVLTGASVLALFIAAVCIAVAVFRSHRWRLGIELAFLTGVWVALGLSLFSAHFSDRPPVTQQHLMLTATGVVLVMLPSAIVATRRVRAADEARESLSGGTEFAGEPNRSQNDGT
jgi:hypothetical protein